MSAEGQPASIAEAIDVLQRARAEIAQVVIGQERVVELSLVTLLSRQHALLEGVPGVAKTLLVRTLGRVLGCPTGRVQFTPDLMPADITGTNVFNLQTNSFTLIPGPVFTTFLLADEINRAPAKTQSALLQAMQERRVTIDRETLALPEEFTVFATQNPVESEGTYPLPEAQKDRFLVRIRMEPPDREGELILAQRTLGTSSPERVLESGNLSPVLGAGGLAALRAVLETTVVREELVPYAVDLVRATRTHEGVMTGAGPRATQALVLAARANALVMGRDFVSPDDIRELAEPVLAHRLILRPEYEIEGSSAAQVVTDILSQIPVPR